VRRLPAVKDHDLLLGDRGLPLDRDPHFVNGPVLGDKVVLHPLEVLPRLVETEKERADVLFFKVLVQLQGKMLDLAPFGKIFLLIDRILICK